MSSGFDHVERELVPGALRGYREWRFNFLGQLSAMNFYYDWNPGRNEATHEQSIPVFISVLEPRPEPCDKVPVKGCSCGLYAHHRPDYPYNYMGYHQRHGSVVGSIKAYGRIILGDLGFKAQYAEIESLVVPAPLVAGVQDRYPRVKIFERFTDLLKEYPPIPVDELLGPKPEPVLKEAIFALPPIQLTAEQVAQFVKLLKQPMAGPDIDKESSE